MQCGLSLNITKRLVAIRSYPRMTTILMNASAVVVSNGFFYYNKEKQQRSKDTGVKILHTFAVGDLVYFAISGPFIKRQIQYNRIPDSIRPFFTKNIECQEMIELEKMEEVFFNIKEHDFFFDVQGKEVRTFKKGLLFIDESKRIRMFLSGLNERDAS